MLGRAGEAAPPIEGRAGDGDGNGATAVAADGSADTEAAAGPQATEPETADEAAGRREQILARAVLGLVVLPFAVSAVALVVGVGGDYMPASDHALTELQMRNIGRHEVLKGLYSRADWSHPGPALFYLLAPFYWLTGGASIGMNLGTLAINGGAVAGTVALARRRGGLPLMLCAALACSLLMRTLGAEFLHDPWNCFVTVLPFALLVLLAWTATCGETWALPVAAGVASYLAQAHVGFVPLALPLLAWAVVGLAAPALRSGDAARRRALIRPALLTLAVLGVMWLPPALDVLFHAPSNLRNIAEWFGDAEDGTKTPLEGWRVVTGQFGGSPEWLTTKRPYSLSGESPFLVSAPLPWLLVPAVAAGVVLWRRGDDDRRLAATLGLVLVLSVAAVARTVGLAFDYRLRWTWILPALAVAATAWVAWRLAAERWPRHVAVRALVPVVTAGLAAVTAVNVVTSATAGTPQEGDSGALEALMPPVLDAVEGADGPVLVSDVWHNGAWYARGVVLQLERQGVDARVPPERAELFGRSRVDDGDAAVHLVVVEDEFVDRFKDEPGMRLVAEWRGVTPEVEADNARQRDELDRRLADGVLTDVQHEYFTTFLGLDLHNRSPATAYAVAVFEEE